MNGYPGIIGVTGLAQHGKDSTGQHLVTQYGYKRYAFADALKSMALALDPFVDDGLGFYRLNHIVEEEGWEGAKQYPEVRRFLQVLGTEGVRDHIGEDAWVDALDRQWTADGMPLAVVTDVRFPNEAAYIKEVGGVLLRVFRPGFDNGVAQHASEAHVLNLPANFNIEAEDLGSLVRAVDAVMGDLREGFYGSVG